MPPPDLVEVGTSSVQVDCGRLSSDAAPVRVNTSNGSPVPTTWPAVTRIRTVRSASGAAAHVASSSPRARPVAARTELGALGRNLDHRAGQLGTQHFLARVQLQRRDSGSWCRDSAATSERGKFVVEETRS